MSHGQGHRRGNHRPAREGQAQEQVPQVAAPRPRGPRPAHGQVQDPHAPRERHELHPGQEGAARLHRGDRGRQGLEAHRHHLRGVRRRLHGPARAVRGVHPEYQQALPGPVQGNLAPHREGRRGEHHPRDDRGHVPRHAAGRHALREAVERRLPQPPSTRC